MTPGRSEQSVQLNPAAVATERRAGLPDQFSALINAWRIVATAAVFIGHATKPDILFDQDIALLGRATIPTFLIISGFFTTLSLAAGGRFLKKVAKRYYMMWSVFVPASILVFFMDLHIIAAGSPFVETFKYDADFSWQRILLDIFNLFTFSGEYWAASTMGQGVFSNHAIWFIDYMMAYTVMTAAIYLLSGWLRVAVLLAAILLAGVPVLLLAPLWFAGVFAFEVERRSFHANGVDPGPWHPVTLARRLGISLTLPAAKALACAAMAAAILVSLWIEVSGAGADLYKWSKSFAPYDLRQYLGMAKRYLWQWAHVPSLLVVLCAARIIFDGKADKTLLRVIRNLSQYSFPIFAIHFPTMYFVQTFIPNYTPRHDVLDPYVMFAVTLALSAAFGYLYFKGIKPYSNALSKKLFEQ